MQKLPILWGLWSKKLLSSFVEVLRSALSERVKSTKVETWYAPMQVAPRDAFYTALWSNFLIFCTYLFHLFLSKSCFVHVLFVVTIAYYTKNYSLFVLIIAMINQTIISHESVFSRNTLTLLTALRKIFQWVRFAKTKVLSTR